MCVCVCVSVVFHKIKFEYTSGLSSICAGWDIDKQGISLDQSEPMTSVVLQDMSLCSCPTSLFCKTLTIKKVFVSNPVWLEAEINIHTYIVT